MGLQGKIVKLGRDQYGRQPTEGITMTHLKKWTRPQNYAGKSWFDYYSAGVGQSRDSGELEQSNFAVMLRELGGESETIIVVRESHWAVGWVEWIAIHESSADAIDIAEHLNARLEDYPVLDEDDFSEREFNAQCEIWQNSSLSDRVDYCRRAGLSIFAARHDYLPADDCGRLGELLLGH